MAPRAPAPPDLVTRVVEIDGESYLLLRYAHTSADEPWPESFTPSERAVARLVVAGFSNREIARQRGSSIATVSNQLQSLYAKLEVHSRVELAAWFVRAKATARAGG